MSTSDVIASFALFVAIVSAIFAWKSAKIAKDIFDRDNNIELNTKNGSSVPKSGIHSTSIDEYETCRIIEISAVGDRFIYLNNFVINYKDKQDILPLDNYILYKDDMYSLPVAVNGFYTGDIAIHVNLSDQLGRLWEKKIILRIHGAGKNDFFVLPEKIKEKRVISND